MFDLGQQGEIAVATEVGRAAGERALMRAVLEDAIRCLIGEVGPRHQRGALAAEARQWIETADPRWPFSFENVCDGLGVNAANLRRRLLRDAPAPALPEPSAPTLVDARQPGGCGVRPRRETPAECDIVQMIRAGRPLRVVAQTFGISISKASILSCGLATRRSAGCVPRAGRIARSQLTSSSRASASCASASASPRPRARAGPRPEPR